MLCQEIIETLEARYPGSCAMDWDNVGLLVERSTSHLCGSGCNG